MKRLLLVFTLLFFAHAVQAQWKAKWGLYVAFEPDAVNPPLARHSQTQTPLTGISYIDSINIANGCSWIVCTGLPALPSTLNYYNIFFRDSVDLVALAGAYLTDPNVDAASPDYNVIPDFTPNDSLLYRSTSSMVCRQWAMALF